MTDKTFGSEAAAASAKITPGATGAEMPASEAAPVVARSVPRRSPLASEQALLGIVLVNWNRWTDTIECLESIFRSTHPVRVIVVDNGSADGSIDRIAEWAAGNLSASAVNPQMSRFSQPPVAKPIKVRRLTPDQLDGAAGASDVPLTLISSSDNLGFAGGNNIGLRLFLSDPRIDYFWLLNNDTVIEPSAPTALVARMAATHNIGMCGTIVRYYHRPDIVQSLNGSRFSMWTGQSRGIGWRTLASSPFDPQRVAADTDFVLGASLAVSRPFLETIGPMEDRYFLYYEEIDWATRNDRRFDIGFAHGATVFHKEGGSIGSSSEAGGRSLGSEYWLARSRLAFIRRNRPWLLPWHWLVTLGLIARRLLRRRGKAAIAIGRALFGMGPLD